MGEVFYWIGLVVAVLFVVGSILFSLLWVYFNALHGRFGTIFFRKSQRRLSLASWHHAKVTLKGSSKAGHGKEDWPADDFPINERPFYLSYQVGRRRYFVMAGYLAPHRHSSIKGTHP